MLQVNLVVDSQVLDHIVMYIWGFVESASVVDLLVHLPTLRP
jgi:hypothetical protein